MEESEMEVTIDKTNGEKRNSLFLTEKALLSLKLVWGI